MSLLPGFESLAASRTAGVYRAGYPWRLVLHRTQGATIAGAVSAYLSHGGWPHVTASYTEQRAVQHIDLFTAARALKNLPGGTETNTLPCVQVELTGFSQDPMSDAEADWVADRVLAPIVAQVPIGLYGPRFWDDDEAAAAGFRLATVGSPIRMTWRDWERFGGICGHQHVPENDHWDPGRVPLARILARLAGPEPEASTPHQEDDMSRIIRHPNGAHYYVGDGVAPVLLKSGSTAAAFEAGKGGVVTLPNDSWADGDAILAAERDAAGYRKRAADTLAAIGMHTGALTEIEAREEQRDLAAGDG